MNLNKVENTALAPEQCVTGFGKTLIVAPHADDESLGCGGLISLLRKYHQSVYILLLSDGTLSHPNSKEYPAQKLRDLREQELINAASKLGVDAENIIFCRYKDRSVPNQSDAYFANAVDSISKMLDILKPESIFVPWRRDPHPDHRAAFQLLKEANNSAGKIYEYAIWLEELGESGDFPTDEEATAFRLDISSVMQNKQDAVSCHISQISDLISDDPEGFKLSEEMLGKFKKPYETFFITK